MSQINTNTVTVNIQNFSDTNELKFKRFMPELYNNWLDVYYKGQRVAIINGMSSPLQWTANGLPVKLVNALENKVRKSLIKA
jgi:hypothetical protein